jgi:Hint domain
MPVGDTVSYNWKVDLGGPPAVAAVDATVTGTLQADGSIKLAGISGTVTVLKDTTSTFGSSNPFVSHPVPAGTTYQIKSLGTFNSVGNDNLFYPSQFSSGSYADSNGIGFWTTGDTPSPAGDQPWLIYATPPPGTPQGGSDFYGPTQPDLYHGVVDSQSATGPLTLPCFLPGTLIRTPEGETAVEDLRVGDDVVVWADGRDEVRAVSWIGSATAVTRPDLQADRSNYPVRILKDAIAEGVPNKDLLVTSDHFAAFDGCLLPVRTLVNGRSIFYDRSQASYTYYHFEAGTHALVYADGMAMDTFLDAGHRRTFSSQAGVIPFKAPDLVADSVLPWNVHPYFVEPIHRAISERAKARGVAVRDTPFALTDESDLHLIADDGRLIQPNRNQDGVATFSLPGSIRSVRLVSRTSRRADTIGPFHDDRRFLGVHVGAIELVEGGVRREIEAHLTEPGLAGWHEIEGEGRWTAGDALLPLGERHPHAIGLLSLRIISGSLYVLDGESVPQKLHKARRQPAALHRGVCVMRGSNSAV